MDTWKNNNPYIELGRAEAQHAGARRTRYPAGSCQGYPVPALSKMNPVLCCDARLCCRPCAGVQDRPPSLWRCQQPRPAVCAARPCCCCTGSQRHAGHVCGADAAAGVQQPRDLAHNRCDVLSEMGRNSCHFSVVRVRILLQASCRCGPAWLASFSCSSSRSRMVHFVDQIS